MTTSRQINIGFSAYVRSFGFIFTHGLWIYFFYPLLLSAILFFVGIELVDMFSDFVIAYIKSVVGLNEADSWLSFFLVKLISWTMTFLFWIVGWFVNAWFLKYIVLILMSPMLAYVSEKTEKILTKKNYPFDMRQLIKDIWRGIFLPSY